MLCLSVVVALLCSFLLGLGDSCFNTQLLSIIGYMFHDNSAPAFAVFKFIQVSFPFSNTLSREMSLASSQHASSLFPLQSIMAALAFFYSNYLLLHWQLLILVVAGFLGSITFFAAEWRAESSRRASDYDSI